MGPLDQFNHLINFLAPALAVGLVLALFGPFVGAKKPGAPGILGQIAINIIAGALTLGAGLWFFGNDGKVTSYAAMLLVCTLCQGLALRR